MGTAKGALWPSWCTVPSPPRPSSAPSVMSLGGISTAGFATNEVEGNGRADGRSCSSDADCDAGRAMLTPSSERLCPPPPEAEAADEEPWSVGAVPRPARARVARSGETEPDVLSFPLHLLSRF